MIFNVKTRAIYFDIVLFTSEINPLQFNEVGYLMKNSLIERPDRSPRFPGRLTEYLRF